MSIINIKYDSLDQQTTLIGGYVQDLEGLIANTQSLVIQIGDTWKGDAADKYCEMLQNYINEAKKMIGILETFKQFANGTSQRFRELDHNCAQTIRNSF